jgi:hypothetical protein
MRICPNCGFRDNPLWRHSRFEFNADYMSWDDFQTEFQELAKLLEGRKNHDPVERGSYFYYRRGTSGIEVYRVPKEDFLVPRERVRH